MKIEKVPGYRFGCEHFPTLAEAQVAAITDLFKDCYAKLSADPTVIFSQTVHEQISGMILDHSEPLMEILTMQDVNKKPARKPRKDKGTKRTPVTNEDAGNEAPPAN